MTDKNVPEAETNQVVTSTRKRPKRVVIGVLLGLVLVVGAAVFLLNKDSASSAPVEAQVSVTAEGFLPAAVHVREGDTVTWVNGLPEREVQIASDPYPANNSFEDLNQEETLANGDTYSFTFEHAGTYSYHDNKNPQFSGQVIVTSE